MGIPEKLTAQASGQLGEVVHAAAMVIPPGATLYTSYSPGAKVLAGGGAIAAAIAAKSANAIAGVAGTFPRQQGVLGVTDDRLVFFKKKTFGVGVGAQIAEWSSADVRIEFIDSLKGSYPGIAVTFSDGSSCVVFGEKKWGLDGLAAAAW